MAKREFKMIDGQLLNSCKDCSYCKTISTNSKIYYCKEFKIPIFDFFAFPSICEFESIFKTIRKVG
jgi:hypothetical protein